MDKKQKHMHIWQFAGDMFEPGYSVKMTDESRFICECGKVKFVKRK